MSEWINFLDLVIDCDTTQVHVDTRDFAGFTETKPYIKEMPYTGLINNDENFVFTDLEVLQYIQDLFNRSGGAKKWRMLCFEMEDGTLVYGSWQLKYLRFYRINEGFVLLCGEHYVKKSDLKLKIHKPF